MMPGQLNLVSVGPGSADLIPPLAREALERSEVIVGYGLYLQWIQPWIKGKEVHSLPLTQERERAALALKLAREGHTVSLVSSGDIGVYGLAPLIFELIEEHETTEIKVIPGITAALSCASLLGAPLGHDFATLSLSDLLCPWPWIEDRASQLAKADIAVVLYNVQSQARQDGIYRILDILLQGRSPSTWCGVIRNAYREDASKQVCTLEELRHLKFDMLTTLVIGTRFTQRKGPYLYAPRGYHGWAGDASVPKKAVWFFTGTRDGNALASACAATGLRTVVSVASKYGAAQAKRTLGDSAALVGRIGEPARRRLLRESEAAAIVDATHPFATAISCQLMRISKELEIPYLRFERPSIRHTHDDAHQSGIKTVSSVTEAAQEAIKLGRRIFLATGVKDLPVFTGQQGSESHEWYSRITPNVSSLEQAANAGIPPFRVCAMQGPFSQNANETLWRDWQIDCVVTKDSGTEGGLPEKIAAARGLGIPLILISRPAMEYPQTKTDIVGVMNWLTAETNPDP